MMPKLVWTHTDNQTYELTIDQDCLLIGRAANNHLCLPSRAVSQYHARVIRLLNDVFLEDLNSTNGTYVNHEMIAKRILRDGDKITVGREVLRFVNPKNWSGVAPSHPESVASTAPELASEPTNEVLSSTINVPNPTQPDTVTPADPVAPSGPEAILFIESGIEAGHTIALDRRVTTIGTPGHAVVAISKRGGRFVAMFIDSGDVDVIPTLNSKPLRAQGTDLKDGDLITLESARMRFRRYPD